MSSTQTLGPRMARRRQMEQQRRRRSSRRRQWRRLTVSAATVVAIVLVATSAAGFVAYNKLNGNIKSEDLDDRLGKRPEPALEGATNILLLGSDTRAGQDNKKYGAHISGARSDTTVLLHLSEGRRNAVLVSIPRDSWVPIPSCEQDDGSMTEAQYNRFNAAYTFGGTACTIKTVERLTNVYVDHYVVVDFSGFEHMIDAMGGVEVCVEEAVTDSESGLDLPAGRSEVGGEQALAFARARKSLGDGSDLSRIERQQALMSAMIRKAKSTDLLLNPPRLYGFLDAATKSITTDPGLGSLNELRKLATSVKGLQAGQVRFVTVPNGLNPDDPATVVWTEDAEVLWEAIRTDSPLPGEPQAKRKKPGKRPSPRATVDPSEVRVTVLNGSGVPGRAGVAADALTNAGFDVVGVGNADSYDYARSVVRYSSDEDAARTLADAVTGADATKSPTAGPDLELVVGKNYTGVESGSSGSAPTPTPTISARKATDRSCSS